MPQFLKTLIILTAFVSMSAKAQLPYVMFNGDTLFVHPTDNSTGIMWWNGSNIYTYANSSYDGKANTDSIIKYQGVGNYAARICYDLDTLGFNDWYLPAMDELNSMCVNKNEIGYFNSNHYWSSNEGDTIVSSAIAWTFEPCLIDGTGAKTIPFNSVRCVRRGGHSYPVHDIDVNGYDTVRIGNQTWLKQNLKTTKYNDGTTIPNVTDNAEWSSLITGAYTVYSYTDAGMNTDAEVIEAYGALYNWFAVNTNKLCPTGYKVPSDSEWTILSDFLGGDLVSGGKLKATNGWFDNGNGTDDFRFAAVPSGARNYDGVFSGIVEYGFWWSSTARDLQDDAWARGLSFDGINIYRETISGYKTSGFSVRCLKDTPCNITADVGTDKTIYQGQSVTLTATGGTSYLWNNDSTSASIIVTPPTTTTYIVTATQGDCTATDNVVVTVKNELPYVMFNGDTLFVHPTDNSEGLEWGGNGTETFATSNTDGKANTDSIIKYLGVGSYSAQVCNDLEAFGFSDWYLPAKDELIALYINKDEIGGFYSSASSYWSSTEQGGYLAWHQAFTGVQDVLPKSMIPGVRCVRKTQPKNFAVYDISGNGYDTVRIGNQTWLKQNLRTTKFNDGTAIPNVTDNAEWSGLTTGAYCNYNNTLNLDTINTYGRLYNWYTVETNKLCPMGYKVPSDSEWTVLSDFLGGDVIAGGKLKEVGITHWSNPNNGATNETNFTALPGGYRDPDGSFYNVGSVGYWWSATENAAEFAWNLDINYEFSVLNRIYYFKASGFSVRCLKDSPCNITANAGTDKTIYQGQSVTLTATGGTSYLWSNDSITASINVTPFVTTTYIVTAYDGICNDVDSVVVTVKNELPYVIFNSDTLFVHPTDNSTGIAWGSSQSTSYATSFTDGKANTDSIIKFLGEGNYAARICYDLDTLGFNDWYLPAIDELNALYLNKETIGGFTFAFYSSSTESNSNDVWLLYFYEGNQVSNLKLDPNSVRCVRKGIHKTNTYPVHDIAGNGYDTVRIGNQTWLKQNLRTTKYNDGTIIPNVKDSTGWAGTYNYGALCYYNNDSLSYSNIYGALYNAYTSTEDICPLGWHVPSENDWNVVNDFLGNNAGGKIKESGTSHWNLPNTGATDIFSFSALPAGHRTSDGNFEFLNEVTYFWSSTQTTEAAAFYIQLSSNDTVIDFNYFGGLSGPTPAYSIRCLKDVLCNINASAGPDQSIYQGQSATLSATGGQSYIWNNDSVTSTTIVTPSVNTTYTVTVTDNGCTASDDVVVTVKNELPYVMFNGDTLFVHPTDNSEGIPWYNGGSGAVINHATSNTNGKVNTDSIIKYQGVGNYAAQLCYDLNAYGFNDWYLPSMDELDTLYRKKVLIGGFSLNSYWSSTEFYSYMALFEVAWNMDFSNGHHDDFNSPNICNVRCVRKNSYPIAFSCTSFFSFTTDTLSNTVTFTDSAQGNNLKYYWDFDDEQYSNHKAPIHKYSKPAIYTACLTILDTVSGCQAKHCEDIKIGKVYCKANYTYTVDTTTNKVVFSDASIGNLTKYYWEFGDGGITAKKNPEHVYPASGFFNVNFNAYNTSTGCMSKISRLIQVGNPNNDCEADFIYTVDMSGKKVSFRNQSKGNVNSYIWNFGTGDTSHTENPVYTFSSGNFYNVCLTAAGQYCKNISCKTVKASEDSTYCKADFIYTIDSVTKTVVFTDKSQGRPNEWNWNFGDGGQSTIQHPEYTYAKSGMYHVHLNIKNKATNCISHQNAFINVADANKKLKCVYGYIADKEFNAKGVLPVEFKGAGYGDAAEVEWDFGDGSKDNTTMTPIHDYTAEGDYNVCMTVRDPFLGESDTYCKTITIVTTGLNKINREINNCIIYPNPAKQSINISFGTEKINSIEIINILGQTLNKKQFEGKNTQEQMDISPLVNGVYFAKIHTARGVVVKMFVKE